MSAIFLILFGWLLCWAGILRLRARQLEQAETNLATMFLTNLLEDDDPEDDDQ